MRRFLPAMANSSSSTFFCGSRADPRAPDGSNIRIFAAFGVRAEPTSMTPLAAADHVCQGGLSCVAGHVVKAISQLRFLTQRKPPVRFLAAGRVRARTKRAFKFAEANKELFELLLVHS